MNISTIDCWEYFTCFRDFPVTVNVGNSVCVLIVEEYLPPFEVTCCIIKKINGVLFLITIEKFLQGVIFLLTHTFINFTITYLVSILL